MMEQKLNLATWSIRNPIPATLFFILISLAGLWGFFHLNIQDFPDLDNPTVSIKLTQPGASPVQLETEVARKVEDKLATLQKLKHISTTISEGEVSILAQFDLSVNLSDALIDIKDAVDSVRNDLPTDLQTPQISKITVGPGGATLSFAVTHSGMDEESLSWFTDDQISKALLGVQGVGRFTRVGGVQREVRVDLKPELLVAHGVTTTDVSRALKRTQQDTSGGRGQLGGAEQGLRTMASVQTAQELKALSIVLADGRSIRLDQVAVVQDTVAERTQIATLDGKPAIGFQVFRMRGADELSIRSNVNAQLAKLAAQNPGLKFDLVTSTVENTEQQYNGSMHMLYEGALLAVIVIWWYLRDWRATLIGALALPLSILPTFAFMSWAGYALNTITLLALAVVVGILVDDAIVEVENIYRHANMGKPIRQATEEAVNEIWLAVLATTAALVVVFLPTAFMSGIPGLVFKQFGWTVVISVWASLIVARIATPMLAVWLLKDQPYHPKDGRFMQWYLHLVRWCLEHRVKTIIITIVLFIGSLALVPLLPTGFIPPGDKNSSVVDIELPPGASLQTTLATAEQARLAIAGIQGIEQVFITAGSAKAAGGPSTGSAGEVRRASITAIFAERGKRPKQQVIESNMRTRLATITGMRWSISGGGPGEKVQLILASTDAQALKATADELAAQMIGLTQLSGITSTAGLERDEITFLPDAALAAERGVSTQAIGETLRIATSGDFSASLAKLNLDQRQLDVRVRMIDEVRKDIDTISNLRVTGKAGTLVPISSVAQITVQSGPSQITRYDRVRNVTVAADLGGQSLGEMLKLVNQLPALKQLPSSVQVIKTGDAEIMQELFRGFGIALVIGVICKYCVLVLLFKNWFQPVTILSALPLCVGGAFAALLMTGGQLSLPALIGVVMLFGIVTKNSILIVEYAILGMREHGMTEHQALVEACHKRVRPVMMTTVAMVAGMLPLAFGWGGDGSFRQPLAIAVIGGLITSTGLSLVVVPVVSTYLTSIEHWVLRLLGLSSKKSTNSTSSSGHASTQT